MHSTHSAITNNISPNCCVIEDNKPVFPHYQRCVAPRRRPAVMGLLRKELMIEKKNGGGGFFFSSLERIFIEERI